MKYEPLARMALTRLLVGKVCLRVSVMEAAFEHFSSLRALRSKRLRKATGLGLTGLSRATVTIGRRGCDWHGRINRRERCNG
jgi:hypothetical protein